MTAAPPPFDRERRGRRFSRGRLRRGRTGQRNALAADRTELRVSQSRLFRGSAAGSAVRRSGAFGRPEGCPAGRVSGRVRRAAGRPFRRCFLRPSSPDELQGRRMPNAARRCGGPPRRLKARTSRPLAACAPQASSRVRLAPKARRTARAVPTCCRRRMPSGPIPINLVNFATKKIFFRKTDTSCRFF